MWRDSAGYVDDALHRFRQLADLLNIRGDRVEFVFAENSSKDHTADRLRLFGRTHRSHIIQRADNCPYWPSIDTPERWRHLAWVQNGVLENIGADADVFLYVESDLTWNPTDLVVLIDHTTEWPVAAAMNMRRDGRYYDIHGTRRNGQRFTADHPYHQDFNGAPLTVDSVGGALAMRAAIARNTRIPETGYVGWCHTIGELGYPIMLCPDVKVIHP